MIEQKEMQSGITAGLPGGKEIARVVDPTGLEEIAEENSNKIVVIMPARSFDDETTARKFADSLFSQNKIDVSWAEMSPEEKEAYKMAATAAQSFDRFATPNTLCGMIAAIYGELDAEDCARIDREWARMRGYILPSDGTSTVARRDR